MSPIALLQPPCVTFTRYPSGSLDKRLVFHSKIQSKGWRQDYRAFDRDVVMELRIYACTGHAWNALMDPGRQAGLSERKVSCHNEWPLSHWHSESSKTKPL